MMAAFCRAAFVCQLGVMRMIKRAKTALLGLVGAILIASGVQAAPITFSVNSTSLQYTSGCTVAPCNATLSGVNIPGSFTLADGATTTNQPAFSFVALQNPQSPRGESGETLNLEARVILDVGGDLLTFVAFGKVEGWGINAAQNNPNVTGNPTLSWTSFVFPANSPLRVIFDTALNVVQGTGGEVRSAIRITNTSVVPLPGGVILLLTGLIGLVGLSWRRRATV